MKLRTSWIVASMSKADHLFSEQGLQLNPPSDCFIQSHVVVAVETRSVRASSASSAASDFAVSSDGKTSSVGEAYDTCASFNINSIMRRCVAASGGRI